MKQPNDLHSEGTDDAQRRASAVQPRPLQTTLLHVASSGGFGVWLLLGLSLAIGVYPAGRGDVLVPLALGGLLIGTGLLSACLHAPWMPNWHGWRIGAGSRPTRDALIALATILPVLAVAGLARGDNTFWVTRLAATALAVCSLTSLIITAFGDARRRVPAMDLRLATQLPLSRVITAAYGGGLWLWLCVAGQDSDGTDDASMNWIILLLMLALLRGLVENLRWQSVLMRLPGLHPRMELQPRRYLAVVLEYAVPCAALLLASFDDGRLLAAGVAALSCLWGMGIELSLYDEALAALPSDR
ncbi:hypothetical protein [Dyella sp. ASV21]|jgi:hypothetical protein|uniref:hypothetical protein n=1 Tax=Dyella sp. ASV21 TaxID=2795114 RepID=UPI0018EC6B73|nr:hypothetical protein [Dyella sp. ASV21]